MNEREKEAIRSLRDLGVSPEKIIAFLIESDEAADSPPVGRTGPAITNAPAEPPRRRGWPSNPPPLDNGAEGHEEEEVILRPAPRGRKPALTEAQRRENRRRYNQKYYKRIKDLERKNLKLSEDLERIRNVSEPYQNVSEVSDVPIRAPFIQAPTYRYVADPIEEYAPSKAPFYLLSFGTLDRTYTTVGMQNGADLAVSPTEGTQNSLVSRQRDTSLYSSCFFNNAKKTEPYLEKEPTTPRAREDNVENVAVQPSFELTPYTPKGSIEEMAVLAYNEQAIAHGWRRVFKLTPVRRAALKARLRDVGLSGWQDQMARAGRSAFLRREGVFVEEHARWRPDFDFFVRESSFIKLLEGEYDNRPAVGRPQTKGGVYRSVREAIARARANGGTGGFNLDR